MKLFLTLAICLLFSVTGMAQHISITVAGLPAERARVASLDGENTTVVDSFAAKEAGKFIFKLPAQHHAGIYRLTFDKNKWLDFIGENEDVQFITEAGAIAESLHVIASGSNKLFYEFLRLNKQYKTKTDLLQLVLARYPKDDPYYETTSARLLQLQQQYADFIASASQQKPGSFIARYIRSSQLPVADYSLPVEKQLAYFKSHALDNVDFTDEGLVHSDLFSNKTIEYLMYYRNPQLPKELLEKEFNTAIDTILNKARVSQPVYKHITEYLINGFKKFGFEKCIEYVLDNYVIKDDLCLDEGSGSSIQKMIEQKKLLPTGAKAPEILLNDTTGNPVSLSGMKAERVLVLFYSVACPHCQSAIPKLLEYYQTRTPGSFEVYAISMDGSREEWLNFVRKHKLNWINVIDPAGWAGKASVEYSIYATPSMFLLDGEKKIISKPVDVRDIVNGK